MDKSREALIEQISSALSELKRAMHLYAADAFTDLGLSLGQLGLLRKIEDSQPVSQAGLAKQLQLTPGAISQVIDALDQANCIVRTADPDDRRSSKLSVSPTGKKLLIRFNELGKQLLSQAFRELPDKDLQTYINTQQTLAKWLESEHQRKKEQ